VRQRFVSLQIPGGKLALAPLAWLAAACVPLAWGQSDKAHRNEFDRKIHLTRLASRLRLDRILIPDTPETPRHSAMTGDLLET
jgi:hypothetical protein